MIEQLCFSFFQIQRLKFGSFWVWGKMGSDCQFPQSLSNSGEVREPSFSSYLNDADGEISVFSADKYFNEGVEDGQKQELNEGVESGNDKDDVFVPVRSNISLGTSSIRSESSWHSRGVLLPGRRSTGEILWKKSFLSRISCRCSCASNKSLKVDDHHRRSAVSTGPGMNRADQLLQVQATLPRKPWMKDSKSLDLPANPSLLQKATAFPVVKKPSPKQRKSATNGGSSSSYTTNSFDLPGKARKSMSDERMINLLNWDDTNPISEDMYIQSAISVEYYTDADSDASSDLFEIDSFTGHRKPSLSGIQIPDTTAPNDL